MIALGYQGFKGLDDMGMTAHNNVHTQLTQTLCNFILLGIFCCTVFVALVDVEHGEIRTGFFHTVQVVLHIPVKILQIPIAEAADQLAGFLC